MCSRPISLGCCRPIYLGCSRPITVGYNTSITCLKSVFDALYAVIKLI